MAIFVWEGRTAQGRLVKGDNLDAPIPGDRGAHGPFDSRARAFNTKRWTRTHRGWLASATVLAAAGLVSLLRSER